MNEVIHTLQKQPSEVFCRNGCSLKFRKIHRKTPVPPATLLKKITLAHVFSCEFCETSKNTPGRLLLTLPERVKKVYRNPFTVKGIWYSVKH